MKYKKYIDLGFKRHNFDDHVEFNETGYGGFSLEKVISDKLSIFATSGNLDKPKLYIKKRNRDTYHIIEITGEIVMDLLHKEVEYNLGYDFTKAC